MRYEDYEEERWRDIKEFPLVPGVIFRAKDPGGNSKVHWVCVLEKKWVGKGWWYALEFAGIPHEQWYTEAEMASIMADPKTMRRDHYGRTRATRKPFNPDRFRARLCGESVERNVSYRIRRVTEKDAAAFTKATGTKDIHKVWTHTGYYPT